MHSFRKTRFIILLATIALLLNCSQSIAANYPLEIIQPQAGLSLTGCATLPCNRFYRQYPGIEYDVKLAVIGGAYGEPSPFSYELLVSPAGMTIDSTGRIRWANPTTSGSPHTVTARATDSEGIQVSVTWTITVTTSGFIFVDAVNGSDANPGTLALPFQTINGWYKSNKFDATYAGYFVYYRAGTYAMNGELEGTLAYMPLRNNNKPKVHLGYPGETAILNFTAANIYVYSGTRDVYFDGFDMINLHLNNRKKGIEIDPDAQRAYFRRMVGRDVLSASSSNASFMFLHSGTTSQFAAFLDNTFRNIEGDYHGILLYTTNKTLIENNLFDDVGTGGSFTIKGISPKASTRRCEIRNNRYTAVGPNIKGIYLANQIDNTDDADNEIRFNSIRVTLSGDNIKVAEINELDGATSGVHHIYRNTFYGRLDFRSIDSTNGPYRLHNNVIINDSGNWECTSCADSSRVVDTDNLKGVPADNIVDANNNLAPAYSAFLGTHGHQIGASSPPAAPTSLRVQ